MRTEEQIKASRIRYYLKNRQAMKYARKYRVGLPEARKKLAEDKNAVSGKTV